MKNNLTKKVAKKTAKVLDSFLSMDANSASCCIVYQPKAPKELERYGVLLFVVVVRRFYHTRLKLR